MTMDLETAATALASGSHTARGLLAQAVAVTERLNPRLNAIIATDLPAAEAAADASDRRRAAGTPFGRLDGMPFTVKDNLAVGGMRATWGSRLFAEHVPAEDDVCVARLRAAGAVLLGKTNTPEFALAAHTTNEVFGATRNPWDLARVPGGSSGGAAAAVASGMVPFALGTDAGGSIRLPAAFCGVSGFRPSVGRIPRLHGFPPISLDFQAIGVMARSARGIAMAMEVLAGPDVRDRASLAFAQQPAPCAGPLRLRLVLAAPDATTDPEIAACLRVAVRQLTGLGHHLEEGALPHDAVGLGPIRAALSAAGVARVVATHEGWQQRVTPAMRAVAERGLSMSGVDYVTAMDDLAAWRAATAEAMHGVDVLVTPTCPVSPWPLQAATPAGVVGFTSFANGMGWPAISIPCGQTADGLPIGLQLVAPYGEDHRILALAEAFQSVTDWQARLPPDLEE